MPGRSRGRLGERRSPVLEDVAELAGVSAMTVSRVLNSPEKVRPQTRDRVMSAVRELGYRPRIATRVPGSGDSGVLGVVTLGTMLYNPAAMLYEIERTARRHHYLISVTGVDAPDSRSLGESVARLCALPADGIIVAVPLESAAAGLAVLPPDLPLVAVGVAGDIPFPMVTVDQRAGAVRAVRHLLSLGHETVWHLAGPAGRVEAGERRAGWEEVLEGEGRPVPEPIVGDWSVRSGYELGRQIVHDSEVTAVFAANDDMALGLQRALWEAGRLVPDDVSVVGFDDIPESGHFFPPLTTVRQDFREIGGRAVRLLLDRLAEAEAEAEAVPAAPVRWRIEPELVARESTGPRRRSGQR